MHKVLRCGTQTGCRSLDAGGRDYARARTGAARQEGEGIAKGVCGVDATDHGVVDMADSNTMNGE